VGASLRTPSAASRIATCPARGGKPRYPSVSQARG
jgi:hypothetical protein